MYDEKEAPPPGSQKPGARRPARGFSLMEVLLLVVVLGIVGAAAGQALQAVAKVPSQTDTVFQIETQMISKMEQIRSMTFDNVPTGTGLSDTVQIAGMSYNRTVTVALADPNGGGASATFKQVTVACGGQSV